MRAITQMLHRTRAVSLVIFGDMFHAKSSLSRNSLEQLQTFRQQHPKLRIKLVLGNHDQPLGTLSASWGIDIVPAEVFADGLAIGHEPDNIQQGAALMLCGHLHPAVRLTSVNDQNCRLPYFWWHKNV